MDCLLVSVVKRGYYGGMISRLFTLLLIANILACPMRCLAFTTNGVTGGDVPPVSCCCCSHDDPAPRSDSPEPSDDDCNCQNCICEGALVKADVDLPESIEYAGQWSRPATTASRPARPSLKTSLRRSRALIGALLCGRDMRIAFNSWLI